ncbi:MAG TPA: ornithine cyclodeaminase family protein [Alphaproteobacteria bacterium]|nr:ornithine cyclodeaminase family protein [Alphaproteobacteria bacterium]
MPLQLLRDAEVRRLLSLDLAIAAVDGALRRFAAGEAAVQPRLRTAVGDVKLSTMGAVIPADDMLGAKVYSTIGGRFRFIVLLFSARTGDALAALEADALTEIRTGAVSAVAAKALARPQASTLAVFGTGVQARGHIAALSRVLPIKAVRVVSRGDASEFCRAMGRAHGVEVVPVRDPAAALAGADLVVTATRSRTPLFSGKLIAPGAFVAAIGATLPTTRELDDEAIRRAAAVIVEWLPQAKEEAGELILPAQAGVLDWAQLRELGPVLAGASPGRRGAEDIILYKSLGIGLEDVAVGAAIYRRAVAEGLLAAAD